jgi:3-hydroxyisobutyrate dehydrogenase
MPETLAFVGVGRMGANMARRLHLDCGHRVAAVYDVHAPSAAALATELGTRHAASLGEVTASADIILTVVTDDAAQLAVFVDPSTGADSLLIGAKGKTFINCATLTPKVHIEAARRAAAVGADTLEACMASSIPQARTGTLFLMCAGERTTFDRLAPGLLAHLSPSPRYIGPAGQAAQVKALVNMVMNIHTAALAEGLGLGQALGLDLDLLRDVFAQTGANSQVLKTDGEDMQNRAHDCYFSGAHAAKDSTIAWTLGAEAGLSLPLAAATKLQYDRLVALGRGHLDKSAVAELTFPGRLA